MFKIYVGNLDYKVKVEQLRELFSVFAPIEDLVIPTDPATSKAKGFAIVMVRDPELGHAAIKAMQGKRLMGRALVVNEAVKKKASTTPTKADLIRNGPFGPRLNRVGDTRSTGLRPSRNPRRSGGGVGRPSTPPASGSVQPASGLKDRSSVDNAAPARPASAMPSLPAKPVSSARGPSPGPDPTRQPTLASGLVPAPAPTSTPAPPPRPKAQKLATPKRASEPDAPS